MHCLRNAAVSLQIFQRDLLEKSMSCDPQRSRELKSVCPMKAAVAEDSVEKVQHYTAAINTKHQKST